jgi:hypothetical protein
MAGKMGESPTQFRYRMRGVTMQMPLEETSGRRSVMQIQSRDTGLIAILRE